jgi:hypothetical protein
MEATHPVNFAQAEAWLHAIRGTRVRVLANWYSVPNSVAVQAMRDIAVAINDAKQAAATGDADAAKAAYRRANAASRTTYRP